MKHTCMIPQPVAVHDKGGNQAKWVEKKRMMSEQDTIFRSQTEGSHAGEMDMRTFERHLLSKCRREHSFVRIWDNREVS